MSQPRPIVFLANGNLNGRVMRLVADEIHRAHHRDVRLISITSLNPIYRWPEERAHPHSLEADIVELPEAERLVRMAAVFVLAAYWEGPSRHLIGVARRAGTPVVCVFADVGYGVHKLDTPDVLERPDRVCAPDPITKGMLAQNGVPESILRNVGSPYFDPVLAALPLPSPPDGALRVGVLANPNATRETLADRDEVSPEGVLPALCRVLGTSRGSRLTIRLHPRQDPARIHEAFPLCESAAFESHPVSTLWDFLAAHHLVVGSNSMALMVARLLGRPVVSFQPPMRDAGVRREIFAAWDVPVATSEPELADMISQRLQYAGPPLAPERLVYQPGRSAEAIWQVILEVLSQPTGDLVASAGQLA